MTTPSPSEVRAAQAMNQCPHCGSKHVTWNWCHDGSVWFHECWDCGNVFRTLGRSGRGEMSEKYDLIYDGRDIRRRILYGTLKDIFLDEYERWCQDFTTALRHVDNMDTCSIPLIRACRFCSVRSALAVR